MSLGRSGITVIGNYPRYLRVATAIGASRFNLGPAYGLLGPLAGPINRLYIQSRMLTSSPFLVALEGDVRLAEGTIGTGLASELQLIRAGGYQQMGRWFVRP